MTPPTAFVCVALLIGGTLSASGTARSLQNYKYEPEYEKEDVTYQVVKKQVVVVVASPPPPVKKVVIIKKPSIFELFKGKLELKKAPAEKPAKPALPASPIPTPVPTPAKTAAAISGVGKK